MSLWMAMQGLDKEFLQIELPLTLEKGTNSIRVSHFAPSLSVELKVKI
jgi:hypothetical protein